MTGKHEFKLTRSEVKSAILSYLYARGFQPQKPPKIYLSNFEVSLSDDSRDDKIQVTATVED